MSWRGRLVFAIRVLIGLAVLGGAFFIAKSFHYQRTAARPFEVWIPGFATSFSLPPIRDCETCGFRARLPRYSGEPAAHLMVPPMLVRVLFYSRAKLKWDPMVQVDGLDPSISEYRLLGLPRFVRFLWVERPVDEGNLRIEVERPRMLGGNDLIAMSVSFLALPRSES